MGLFDRVKESLRKTAQLLTTDLGSLLKGEKLGPEALRELEERLVRCDVGSATAKAIAREVGEAAARGEAPRSEDLSRLLREGVLARLAKATDPGELPRPCVILLLGVNGAGKTTTAGKLAGYFSSQGRKVLLAAGDTFRAAAEEQLTEWASRAKVALVRGSHGAAPSSVVFDALQGGLAEGRDLFLVDTAGRLHNRSNLMEELRKMVRVAGKAAPGVPQEKWLVLDANTGQNGLAQAREFGRDMGLTGVVLTKVDGTAKGGIVVALADQLGLPVRFMGVGEGLDDLVPFDRADFAKALVPDPAG
jgi:fused signal recognition particle receptor